jgi:hypothetical protein
MAYVNGQPMPLGYLGALRLDQDVRSTPRLIQAGYHKLRELHDADRATPIYFTSIMADNVPARRILEANLKDMPTYRFVAEFVTLIFRPRRKSNSHARTVDQAEILSLLADRRDQFAPVWNSESLHSLVACGLDARAFRIIHSGSTPIACAAAWDTSSFKQSVVRGYSSAMRWARPFSKLLGSFTSVPRLPKIGAPLRLTYLSHVCVPADRAEMLIPLVESLDVGGVLVAGFDARDSRLSVLRRAFGGRELRSRLYVVHWADGRAIAESLEKSGRESFLKKYSRPHFLLTEVALL